MNSSIAAPHIGKSTLFVLQACPALYDCGEETGTGIKRIVAAIQTPDGEQATCTKKLTRRKLPESSH